ncbi:hypothetical protein [Streptomyces sp. NRRL S-481]|nr:hypothetical protein [Streptomyces sp. NRRL S-481]
MPSLTKKMKKTGTAFRTAGTLAAGAALTLASRRPPHSPWP